jgi:hypothetical protein
MYWWFISNDDPTKNLELRGVGQAPQVEVDNKSIYYPLGRSGALVESGTIQGMSMNLSMTFKDENDITAKEYYEGLEALRDYITGSIFLKDNWGNRWKVDISNISRDYLDSILEIYSVNCTVTEVE